MRTALFTLLGFFLVCLIVKNSQEASKGMNFWDFMLKFTHLSSLSMGADAKTDDFLKQMKDKKEDLDYLQNQIKNLRMGLKEMPNEDQNQYFRDLLEKYQDQEYKLNQQITQMDQTLQEKLQKLSPKEADQSARLIGQNQLNFQEQARRVREMVESNQMRAREQLEMLSDLMEQHQMLLEAMIDRMNTLMEQRQNRPGN
jgi:hypothetical protein